MQVDDDAIYDYAVIQLGLIDPENTDRMRAWSESYGYIDPDDLTGDLIRDLAVEYGIIIPRPINPHAYHDDNNHPGTIRWCPDPTCEVNNGA